MRMRKKYLAKFPSFRRTPVAIAQPQFEPLDRASIRGNTVILYSHANVLTSIFTENHFTQTNSIRVLALCHIIKYK